jgi:thiamine biosynthesis lipoprotein
VKSIHPFICAVFILSCSGSVIHMSKPQLGTIVNLTFIADQEAAPGIARDVFAEIERIENLMSPVRTASDVYRLNAGAGRGPVAVGAETFGLIKKSSEVSSETGGCFDITFASIARLWDYKNKNFSPPSREAVAGLLPLVNFRNVVMHPERRSISFARPGVKIGLGGIAKGYAVQRGVEVLRKRGVDSAIVEAGGDLQVMGNNRGKSWVTGLRHPRKNAILLAIELDDMDAVATSGDYERLVMRGDRRYHHIIDPRTGYPTDTFSSVTVISKNAVLSDAYATAIFVMGLEGAREFLNRHAEIGVILADQQVNVYISQRLKDRITLLDKAKVEWL